jgi:hypothetical protein
MSSGPPIKRLKQSMLTSFNKPRQPIQHRNDETTFLGYNVVSVPSDGDCLFSAIAHQLSIGTGKEPSSAEEIRKQLVDYTRGHPSMTNSIALAGQWDYVNCNQTCFFIQLFWPGATCFMQRHTINPRGCC